MATRPPTDSAERLHLPDRLALRPDEAAEAIGVSPGKLRQMLPELPHFRSGGCVLIPVDGLRQWLSEQTQPGENRVDAAVDEVLASINKG
jgi:hypothetical protein